METAEEGHDFSTDHNVVEMGDNKIGVMHVDIEAHRRQEPVARLDEKTQETEHEDHRRS